MNAFAGKGKNLPHLDDLPTEVLLVIFKHCSLRDLGNLCKTCKRLNIVVRDFIWYGKSRKALVTNQIGTDIQNRYVNNTFVFGEWLTTACTTFNGTTT
jgi:F-box domain.